MNSRSTMSFSNFIFGIPYINNPPARSARSYTVTECPAWFNSSALASPAGPDPIIAIFLPVRLLGILGVIQPFSNPLSIIVRSILFN